MTIILLVTGARPITMVSCILLLCIVTKFSNELQFKPHKTTNGIPDKICKWCAHSVCIFYQLEKIPGQIMSNLFFFCLLILYLINLLVISETKGGCDFLVSPESSNRLTYYMKHGSMTGDELYLPCVWVLTVYKYAFKIYMHHTVIRLCLVCDQSRM